MLPDRPELNLTGRKHNVEPLTADQARPARRPYRTPDQLRAELDAERRAAKPRKPGFRRPRLSSRKPRPRDDWRSL